MPRPRSSMRLAFPTTLFEGEAGVRVDEFRSRFPITSDRAYLFSGAMAPAADTVISAAREWLSDWASQPLRRYDSALTEMDALRDAVGAVLRVDGGHVA